MISPTSALTAAVAATFLVAHALAASVASTVPATYWALQSDAGGCQLPQATYTTADALALGQHPALGSLIYSPGLCGKLVTVTCPGGTPVTAVVASTCNLGSPSCGVDLIDRTWRTATGNKPPGQAQCTVSLATDKNPIQSGGPLCYNRPGTPGSAYYKSLGVLNTGSEIPAAAVFAGVHGSWSNGGWFEFNSGGRELFTNNAVVVFTHRSGRTASFTLQDCKQSVGVQIFK
ncbi:hypothetical protein BDZ88DRAFT_430817 [Geranomyces variabilis]|nr:hypothetical protein BDZ88DRAFT_430817 [Geranomyces variabilis]KAJ3134286.1 hypothetical protein HDU90_005152 [Geranomyces variabilis]